MELLSPPTATLLQFLADIVRTPRLRTIREFAEQEIVLPTGPHQGRKFKVSRQPFAALWFDEIDSGRWRRFACTGPVQSGKTLMGFVIVLMYHLFEVGESVICGLPGMDMAADKWRDDILPVIEASRYRDQLPAKGAGSRGGKIKAIKFRNGATLRFMTAGGDDKSRAGKTARIVVITEADGMDEASETSREADPVSQIEARTQAFGDRARIYLECTVSIPSGRIWREYQAGTASAIEVRCPHCRQYVLPERKHLVGWQDAENALDAAARTRIACPGCGALWEEKDRQTANRDCQIHHRDGAKTDTLGFRWTAVHNLLVSMAEIGKREWQAARSESPDDEKALRQFCWAVPVEPDQVDLSLTDWTHVLSRQGNWQRGAIPEDAELITCGLDLGQHLCHWTATAWRLERTPHILDYGVLEVSSVELGVERAILLALRDFRERIINAGWNGRRPKRTFIDAGNWQDTVYAFIRETGGQVFPCKGFGEQQVRHNRVLDQLGWDKEPQPQSGVILVKLLADRWKTAVHNALQTPAGLAGALTLWRADRPAAHQSFAKHLTAEKQVQEVIPGKGVRTRWELDGKRPNHWLDATALSFAAFGTLPAATETTHEREQRELTTPDGRPFLATHR
jgi:phage terminase large subunit GpA-like protein